jgi:glycolate oxidase iron-sulfur subunit
MDGMFDDPSSPARERIVALADQCVKCGLCLPYCPTYAQDRLEAESPRGRIALARAVAEGSLPAADRLRAHLDHCLGCLGCERVCPSDVRYGELLVETRALLGPSPQRPRLLLGLLKRPALLRAATTLAGWLRAARWAPALARRLLPAGSAWRAAVAVLPAQPPAKTSRLKPLPRPKETLGRVALFPGCVASVDDAAAQEAARQLLGAAGFVVQMLPAFCCGAMDLHDGATEGAERSALRVRDAWHAADADILATVTPGCLGTLRRALPGVRVEHVPGLLAAHADTLHFRPLAERVALHLPCTQVNVAGDGAALTALLRRVPKLDVQLVPAPPYCCGAAGSHMLQFPERAAALRREKQAQIAALAPDRLLSCNIGCRLHLGADSTGAPPSAHPLTVLAEQLESGSIAAEAAPTTEGSPLRTKVAST